MSLTRPPGSGKLRVMKLERVLPIVTALAILAGSCAPQSPEADPEEQLLGSLDPNHALEEIRRFSTAVQTPSGLGAGTAAAGTEQEEVLAAHVEEKFRSHGLDVSRHTYPVRVYSYGPAEVSVAGERLPAVILYGSPGTYGTRDGRAYRRGNWGGNKVLRARLAYGGRGTRADIAAAGNVRGKILLLLRDDTAAGWPSLAALEAATQGAVAVIFFGVEGEGTLLEDALRQDSLLGSNRIPAFSIRRSDGERLRGELARRPMEAELSCEAKEHNGRSVNVLGELRGSRFPDERIIVSAHIDRWFEGCQDNASGVGGMLELVRAIVGRGTPQRTFLFVGVGSEEAGGVQTLDEWLTGSYALVKDKPELFQNAVFVLNLDGLGWRGERGSLNVSPEGEPFAKAIVAALGLEARIKIVPRISTWVDAWSYSSVAGATTMFNGWESDYDQYYHTDYDVCKDELLANLETDLRLSLLALGRIDRSDSPPIDLASLASWIRRSYREDAARVPGVSFAAFHAALSQFEVATTQNAHRLETARSAGDEALTKCNLRLMEVRNGLIPALVATGEDVAETRTYRYSIDAERLAEILLALPSADADEQVSRDAITKVIEIMEAGDDFQDAGPAPSWTFQFSRAMLQRYKRRSDENRTWSREHGQMMESISLEVFGLHQRLRRVLDSKKTVWSFDAAGAARKTSDLRARTVERLKASLVGVTEALQAATLRLRARD